MVNNTTDNREDIKDQPSSDSTDNGQLENHTSGNTETMKPQGFPAEKNATNDDGAIS